MPLLSSVTGGILWLVACALLPQRQERTKGLWCGKPSVLVHSDNDDQVAYTGCVIKNRNVYLTVPEAGNSKIKVLEDLVSGESPLLGS